MNDGGCKVDPDYQMQREELVSKPGRWSVDKLLNFWRCVCNDEIRPVFEKKISAFVQELERVAPVCDKHCYDVNESANSGIMARLIAFSKP